jgi:hypothetical protein
MNHPEIDAGIMRRHVLEASDDQVLDAARIVRSALEGESNDAEHDALVLVADLLGIEYEV